MATSTGERSRKRIVDKLDSAIKNDFKDFNVSEIIKGGSLGHGTGVERSDIDLVVYSRDISDQEVFQQEDMFKKWLIQLDEFLKKKFKSEYNKKKIQPRSVKFKFMSTVKVDLLVSPYYEHPQKFYNFLKMIPKNKRSGFTVCASKWQVGFFKRQKPEVKEHIRKAKLWRDEEWPEEEEKKPSSYLISLLVVAAYRNNPNNVRQGMIDLPLDVKTLDETWSDYYNLEDVQTLLPACPRIVDPANPANNVLESGLQTSWKKKSHILSRYMLSVNAKKRRSGYMHQPPGLTLSEASHVRELTSRCHSWSQRQWKHDDDEEDDNGRPSKYFLFILILEAFYRIQDEKNKKQVKRLKSYVHLPKKLITLVEELEGESDNLDLELPLSAKLANKNYENKKPPCPRICDPVNPTNNLYLTEIERQEDPTLTKWTVLKERIQHIDLSRNEQ